MWGSTRRLGAERCWKWRIKAMDAERWCWRKNPTGMGQTRGPSRLEMGDFGYPILVSHHCTKIKEVISKVAMSFPSSNLTLCLSCGKVDLNFNVSTEDEVWQCCLQSLHLPSNTQLWLAGKSHINGGFYGINIVQWGSSIT